MWFLRLFFLQGLILIPFSLKAQWERLPNPPDSTVTEIASMKGNLFAISKGYVYQSSDHGMRWSIPGDSIDANRLVELKGMIFGLIHSVDQHIWRWNGNWNKFASPVYDDLATIHDTLFGSKWGAVYISSDSGATWKQTSPIPDDYVEPIFTFGDTIFALINVGVSGWPVYYSTDAGQNWNKAGTMPTDDFGYFYFRRANSDFDLAVYHRDHINISHDRGFHWQTIGKEITTFIKNYNNTLLFGLQDSNIYRSGLFKLAGERLVQLLPDTEVSTINGFAADEDYAYIATSKKGIWRTSLSNLNLSSVKEKTVTDVRIFPNPSQGMIKIETANEVLCEIKIYDELGVVRQTLSSVPAGTELTILPKLSDGIYTIIITSANKKYASKLVLSRY